MLQCWKTEPGERITFTRLLHSFEDLMAKEADYLELLLSANYIDDIPEDRPLFLSTETFLCTTSNTLNCMCQNTVGDPLDLYDDKLNEHVSNNPDCLMINYKTQLAPLTGLQDHKSDSDNYSGYELSLCTERGTCNHLLDQSQQTNHDSQTNHDQQTNYDPQTSHDQHTHSWSNMLYDPSQI